ARRARRSRRRHRTAAAPRSALPRCSLCCLLSHADPRLLHSFPTRRSSDLTKTFRSPSWGTRAAQCWSSRTSSIRIAAAPRGLSRSEEHTSELQSLAYFVCRLLLEKNNRQTGPRRSDLHGREEKLADQVPKR